jgi:hypothetical protein
MFYNILNRLRNRLQKKLRKRAKINIAICRIFVPRYSLSTLFRR